MNAKFFLKQSRARWLKSSILDPILLTSALMKNKSENWKEKEEKDRMEKRNKTNMPNLSSLLIILFFAFYLFSFLCSLVIFYHFWRFPPPVDLKTKKIISFLFSGLIFFFLLSLFSLFLIG